ncbi:MAG: SDR family oxidoreductase [Myxococcota bacterium]
MGRVDGKVAIVTGAASGLGRAASAALVREGGRVVLADLDLERGSRLASQLGDATRFIEHDVRDEASWVRLLDQARSALGRLDALVNNAGIVRVRSIEDTSLDDWDAVMAVNARGVFLGCKHAVRAMRESGGSIVNVSSIAALMGTAPFLAYSASKGAVRSLSKSVAAHCRQRGYTIRCNSIHPGGIDTPLVQGVRDDPGLAANSDLLESSRPERSLARPEDVADLILFLVSDESVRINGAELVIDDGHTST